MQYVDQVTAIMIVVVPVLTTAFTVLGGVIKIISLVNKMKVDTTNELTQRTSKMSKSFDDIAILRAKIESMEKVMLEQQPKKARKVQ